MKIIFSTIFCMFLIAPSFAQFDKPSIQAGLGICTPFKDLKGDYFRYITLDGIPYIAPDTNLYSNNMGAKTGMYFFAKGEINFDKYSILRGVVGISFNTFNLFQPTQQGNIGVRVIIHDTVHIIPSSASMNYSVNNFGLTLGLELSPLAFTNVFSPYIGANIAFNNFSSTLTRVEGSYDTVSFSTSGFRIGFNIDAGIEAKFNKHIGMVLGIKYDFGNVWLKNTSSTIADRYEWGKGNASLNDAAGPYFSAISSPVISSDVYLLNSKQKSLDWGTIYVGVTYTFDLKEKSKKKPPAIQ